MYTVSVIIPCYNAELYVQEAIESVLSQNVPALELICIDDGSTDNTIDVLNQLEAKYPLLTIEQQENQGATAARNKGLNHAKGDYIQFLDADDVLRPNKFEHQLELAEQDDYPELIIGAYSKYDSSGKLFYSHRPTDGKDSIWLKLMRTRLGITSANLFLRESLIDSGGWDESLRSSQEYDLMFRMMQNGARASLCPEMDTEVHQRNQNSITSSNQGENWKRYLNLRLRMRDHIIENVSDAETEQIDQVIFDIIRLLYPFDKEEAFHLLKNELPEGFMPSVSEYTSGSYVTMFKLLGFKGTERLRGMMRKQ